MSDPFVPKSDSSAPANAGATVGGVPNRKTKPSGIYIALVVFILALSLRAGHNLNLRHQVWMLNDAYNYLFTGNLILRAIQEPSKLQELLRRQEHPVIPDHLKLASRELPDRLSLDGLLYPSYLAFAQAVGGVGNGVAMEESRLTVCICNSIVDSMNCVLVFLAGSIAFGTGVGGVAGLLAAVYPPFVVNTQQCLSEPLATFFISLWLLALFRSIKLAGASWRIEAVSAIMLGVSTAFLIMIKPTHLLLAFTVAMVLATVRVYRRFNRGSSDDKADAFDKPPDPRRALIFALLSVVSAASILLPAVGITKAVTGDWQFFAKRSPFENLALTLNASQDGWRAYPYPGDFPANSQEMLEMAKQVVLGDSVGELLLIGIKKVSRLWSGIANDYQYSVLFFGYDVQVFIHRLLLVFAFVGVVILLVRTKTIWNSRRVLCGLVLLSTIFFHSIYLAFEAMPRYAMTAVPPIIVLAAYGMVSAYRSALAPPYFLAPVATMSCLLILLQTSREQCSLIAGVLGERFVGFAPALTAASQCLWIMGIIGVCVSLLVVGPVTLRKTVTCPEATTWITPAIKFVYAVAILIVTIVTIVSSTNRRDWTEWKCELRPGQLAKQIIQLPATFERKESAILLDCESSSFPPPISIRVNGVDIEEKPIPFAQLAGNASSIVDGLMQTEFVMNKDSRAFRQWWAIPLSAHCLKPGFENEIVIANSSNSPATIFGDYRCDGKNDLLPSFWRFSYTKGYCSIERGDPRIMEPVPSSNSVKSAIKSSMFASGQWVGDLSSAWGSQTGRYRVRILGCAGAGSGTKFDLKMDPVELIENNSVCEIAGNNPVSMFPKLIEPHRLPSNLAADARFEFSCELRSISSSSESVVSLLFGDSPGWSSPWQPRSVPVTREWTRVVFSDVLPRQVQPGSEIKLMVVPYQSDLIYTNRKEAIGSKVEIRNASVSFLPPTELGPLNQANTTIH